MSTPHDAHHHGHSAGAPTALAPELTHGDHALATLTVETGSLACEACVTCVEERLGEHPHVVSYHVDSKHEVAHVTIHEGMVAADQLAELIAEAAGLVTRPRAHQPTGEGRRPCRPRRGAGCN
jgi:cation transport ATPase